jgi:hypothetical protein
MWLLGHSPSTDKEKFKHAGFELKYGSDQPAESAMPGENEQ